MNVIEFHSYVDFKKYLNIDHKNGDWPRVVQVRKNNLNKTLMLSRY